ncbi:hypothetical protein FKM82_006190 [Ascaphus truei]
MWHAYWIVIIFKQRLLGYCEDSPSGWPELTSSAFYIWHSRVAVPRRFLYARRRRAISLPLQVRLQSPSPLQRWTRVVRDRLTSP